MSFRLAILGVVLYCLSIVLGEPAAGLTEDSAELGPVAEAIRRLNPRVLPAETGGPRPERLSRLVAEDVRRRRDELNRRDLETWRSIRNRDGWERLKAPRIEALRRSLGQFPAAPRDLRLTTTKVLHGDGFQIDCLVFESRPGLLVTANLYRPAGVPSGSPQHMPGILICHSHHNPKSQGELQDMGMTWARQGCLVLVMDQLGHGERRQHPFRAAEDFPKEFPVGRQDYYFRYNLGMQLQLIGDSLIGWMVWDLMRGVDLLLQQPGVDPERILLLGAVAGGGDPAAVTAALDHRVKAVVPFNFGGPQPETVYPLPDDAQQRFNYMGEGSWESTRNLRLSARDGFLPWVIVGAVAPRCLIYAHEFSWDEPRDPVWSRLRTIYGFYEVPQNVTSLCGWGRVQLSSAQASHCNNIGPAHRKQIYPAFQRWFGMAVPQEYQAPRAPAELASLEGLDSAQALSLTPVHRLADHIAQERMATFRTELARLTPAARRKAMQNAWAGLLGDIEPGAPHGPQPVAAAEGPIRVIRAACAPAQGILVPVLVLLPAASQSSSIPCVIGVAQDGKAGFLQHRADELSRLLARGIAVCLPDLRGTGETSLGTDRGRSSEATGLSSSELMLGNTFVGLRLKDLRSVLRWLRTFPEIDAKRIGLWGDSFTPENGPDRRLDVPLGSGEEPPSAEPLGPLLALLTGLFEDEVAAVVAQNGVIGFRSALQSPFVGIPHDVVVPGLLTAGDVSDLAAVLAPQPLLLQRFVDAANRAVSVEAARASWAGAASAYQAVGAGEKLVIGDGTQPVADWLVRQFFTPQ